MPFTPRDQEILGMIRLCRICRGPIHPVLDLGTLALPYFRRPEDPPVPTAPLDLRTCDTCGLLQLAHTVPPDALYRQYWYRSGINETMQAELVSIVRAALLEVAVHPDDVIVDVGANDGTLLREYPRQRAHWSAVRIAFEPATNLAPALESACEILVPTYFPAGAVDLVRLPLTGVVKILTSIAMFYDVDDPTAFVTMVDALLADDGVWILQFQDLAQMIEATAIDNVCHEHLTYWSLAAFNYFLERSGVDLHVTHAERRPINGGSLRLFVRRRSWPVAGTVAAALQAEAPSIGWQALERFGWMATVVRQQIASVVGEALTRGLTIDLYGASTKANTLLQYCGFTGATIRQAWERNPEKIGLLTATGIPIVSEETGRAAPPDLLLAGIWQFREQVIAREAAYLAGGGRILFPLPEVDLVRGS